MRFLLFGYAVQESLGTTLDESDVAPVEDTVLRCVDFVHVKTHDGMPVKRGNTDSQGESCLIGGINGIRGAGKRCAVGFVCHKRGSQMLIQGISAALLRTSRKWAPSETQSKFRSGVTFIFSLCSLRKAEEPSIPSSS